VWTSALGEHFLPWAALRVFSGFLPSTLGGVLRRSVFISLVSPQGGCFAAQNPRHTTRLLHSQALLRGPLGRASLFSPDNQLPPVPTEPLPAVGRSKLSQSLRSRGKQPPPERARRPFKLFIPASAHSCPETGKPPGMPLYLTHTYKIAQPVRVRICSTSFPLIRGALNLPSRVAPLARSRAPPSRKPVSETVRGSFPFPSFFPPSLSLSRFQVLATPLAGP